MTAFKLSRTSLVSRGVLAASRFEMVALAAALATFLVQLPFLREPMGTDEAMYFTVAKFSPLPYVDVIDQKPPLIYAWYHVALLLNGNVASGEVVRLLAAGVLALTAFVLFQTGRVMLDARLGAVAAVMFALLCLNQFVVRDANTETFALLPFSVALLAFVRASREYDGRVWFLCGVFAALAVSTKTTFALPSAMLCLLALRQRPRAGLTILGGLAIVGLLVPLLWLLTGHLRDFLYANAGFNLKYAAAVPWQDRPIGALRLISALLPCLPVVLLAVYGTFRRRHPFIASLTLVGVAGLTAVTATGLALDYYLAALFPVMALLSASGWLALLDHGDTPRPRRVFRVVLIGGVALSAVLLAPVFFAGSPDRSHSRKYGDGSDTLATRLAERVLAISPPSDRVEVIGKAVQVYPLAGRKPPSRVAFTGFLRFDDALVEPTLSALEASPPELIVELVEHENGARDQRFAQLIDSRYELQETLRYEGSTAYIWRRR